MKKRIKWENIIPKPIQRMQARYYELKDRFIEVDYEYDKKAIQEKEEQEEQFYTEKKDNTMIYVLTAILIIIVFIFVIPSQFI